MICFLYGTVVLLDCILILLTLVFLLVNNVVCLFVFRINLIHVHVLYIWDLLKNIYGTISLYMEIPYTVDLLLYSYLSSQTLFK